MKLHSIQLTSKNNKQSGSYFYSPIVKIDNKYFRCCVIKSTNVLKLKDVDISTLVPLSEI